MSKRLRDEASVESLKAILGDISTQLCESLLHRANDNIEAAIDLYFSNPPVVTTQRKKSDRFNIGDLVITGKAKKKKELQSERRKQTKLI